MVEMLGVLAVVGVLSVGGIVGYTHAMNKYHANEIVSEVSMMAVTASQGLLLNGDFTLDEYGDEVAGYSYGYNVDFGGIEDRFSITVQGVEDGVCENIKNMNFSALNQILVNGTADGDCTDPSDVEFVFYNDLGGERNGKGDEENGNEKTYGYCNEYSCIECTEGKTAYCNEETCICTDGIRGKDWECGDYYDCIECSDGKIPYCSIGACVCADGERGKDWECGDWACVACEKGKIATCREYGCACLNATE
jgi:hypothetical protein